MILETKEGGDTGDKGEINDKVPVFVAKLLLSVCCVGVAKCVILETKERGDSRDKGEVNGTVLCEWWGCCCHCVVLV